MYTNYAVIIWPYNVIKIFETFKEAKAYIHTFAVEHNDPKIGKNMLFTFESALKLWTNVSNDILLQDIRTVYRSKRFLKALYEKYLAYAVLACEMHKPRYAYEHILDAAYSKIEWCNNVREEAIESYLFHSNNGDIEWLNDFGIFMVLHAEEATKEFDAMSVACRYTHSTIKYMIANCDELQKFTPKLRKYTSPGEHCKRITVRQRQAVFLDFVCTELTFPMVRPSWLPK